MNKIMAENKMNWMVENYKNNKLNYLIQSIGEKKGTIVMPTGAGKSGVTYEDMIWHILNAKEGEKIVFNLACPILKLEAQFVNDFVSVLREIFPERCENGEFMFFINSSADGKAYKIDGLGADVKSFKDIEDFRVSKTAKFAIVASCHKSLMKFAEKVDYLKGFTTTINYFDEAHLIVNETRDDRDYDKLTAEGQKRWRSLEKMCECDYLYAMTATPDGYVTKIINDKGKPSKVNEYGYIYEIPAMELIANNTILPVETFLQMVGNGDSEKITPEICYSFMEAVKKENPNIHHKILVSCSNTDHLCELRDSVSKFAKVFSTCAREGENTNNIDGNDDNCNEYIDIDEVDFIKQVDSYDGDCFVFHIKKLTQGIDIKTLTDCIIYNSTRVNDGVKRKILQTIGRVLRPMAGERGMEKEKRLKKNGNVLFLIGEKDYDAVVKQMTHFLLKYYGREGIEAFCLDHGKDFGNIGKLKGTYAFGDGKAGDDYFDYYELLINKLLINLEKFVKENVLPKYQMFIRASNGKPNPNLVPLAIVEIKRKFALYDGEHSTAEILSENEMMKAVNALFNKYGIA